MNHFVKWTAIGSSTLCIALVSWMFFEPHAIATIMQDQIGGQTESPNEPARQQAATPVRSSTVQSGLSQAARPTTVGTRYPARVATQSAVSSIAPVPAQSGQAISQTAPALIGQGSFPADGIARPSLAPGQAPGITLPGYTPVQGIAGTSPAPVSSFTVANFAMSPEEHALAAETTRIVGEIREAAEDEDRQEELLEKLETVLGDHFDLRLKTREDELEELETRMKRLQEELDERRAAKDEIVELRLRSLFNEAVGLGF